MGARAPGTPRVLRGIHSPIRDSDPSIRNAMTRRILRRAALLLPLAALAACEDLISGLSGDVAGLSIQDATGTELVRVGSAGTVNGSLSVTQGGARDLDVVLRTASGSAVTPGVGQTVRVTVVNSAVASWTGDDAGTLRGLQRGSTSMRVDLLGAGAAVYTSPSIAIQVN
jgi:hypothetical protein